MISVFRKGTPQIVGGLGDGTRTSPWYWYGKTSGQTVAVNNSNASSGDKYRVYLRVKLKGGTTYTIGQTTIDSSGDGMIWLYNSAMSEVASDDHSGGEINGLEVQDVMSYTPSADGVYIIGAGAYDYATGNFTVAISPAPEQETLPEIEYQYPTSSGFNSLGRPLKFRNAKEAGCEISRIPEEGLVFYAPLDKEASTAVTGQSLSKVGNVTFQTVDGVPCAYFDKGDGYETPAINFCGFPDGFTFSFLCKNMENSGTVVLLLGDYLEYNCLIYVSQTALAFLSGGVTVRGTFENNGKMHHLTGRYTNGCLDIFSDGVLAGSGEIVPDANDYGGVTRIAKRYPYESQTSEGFKGYLAALRIYNRALSDYEIKALSREFNV